MNRSGQILHQQVLQFVRRFGFITKGIFFRYFCRKSKTQKYVHWKILIKDGLLCECSAWPGVFTLSPIGRGVTQQEIVATVPAALSHDVFAAKTLLEFLESGLVSESWIEVELARHPVTASEILGVLQPDKFPDLVLELIVPFGKVRVAIEIELSLKSKRRYQIISTKYQAMTKIDLVVYCCGSHGIYRTVMQAFGKISESLVPPSVNKPLFMALEFPFPGTEAITKSDLKTAHNPESNSRKWTTSDE